VIANGTLASGSAEAFYFDGPLRLGWRLFIRGKAEAFFSKHLGLEE
jgi:hypothetical protein